MNQGTLKKQNKDVLHGICNDLGIAFEADDFKTDLAKKIVEHEGWSTHALYVAPSTEPLSELAKLQAECEEKGIEFEVGDDEEKLKSLIAEHDALDKKDTPSQDDEDESSLSDEEKESIALQKECVERGIELTGEESIDELKEKIEADNTQNIEAAERDSAIEVAKKEGVEIDAENDSTEQILEKISERRVALQQLVADKKAHEEKIAAQIALGIDFDTLQRTTSILIDMTKQMIKQQDKAQKSPDRFHAAVKDLERLRREVFIR